VSTTITVDAPWLAERRAAGADLLVLDVRTPAEFASAHIEGSYNVPLDTLKEHRTDVARHLDTDVVLVCRSGARAEQADASLTEIGQPNLHVLRGGVSAWEAAGQHVVRGTQRWELERQVRLVAGTIVLGSVLASTLAPATKWIAGGIGAGLTFAAVSNTCAMGMMLAKLPYNRVEGTDPAALLAQLADR
jgi:rhodanese-related sulfurtransferase